MRREREQRSQNPIFEKRVKVTIGPELIDPIFSHVDNLDQLKLLQDTRKRVMNEHGFGLQMLQEHDLLPFLIENHSQHKGQVLPGEVEIQIGITTSLSRIIFHQQIIKDNNVLVDTQCEYILVNDKGRPQRIPKEFVERLHTAALGHSSTS